VVRSLRARWRATTGVGTMQTAERGGVGGRWRRLVLCAAAVSALFIVWLLVGVAYADGSALTAPAKLVPGTTVTLQVSGFPPGANVSVLVGVHYNPPANCCGSPIYPAAGDPPLVTDPNGSLTFGWPVPTTYEQCVDVPCTNNPPPGNTHRYTPGQRVNIFVETDPNATDVNYTSASVIATIVSPPDVCRLRYPSGIERTTKIRFGRQTLFDRQASLYQVCSGFGAPDHVGFKLTPAMQCALIAAAATYGGPVVNKGVSTGCTGGDIVNAYSSGDWLGAVTSYGCGYFSDIFAGGVGVFAAGATSETGPGAVAVGVSTYKALAAGLKIVCGGVFQGVGTALGHNLETRHQTHVAIDVIRHGKCMKLTRRFGQLQWSALKCRRL